MPTPYQMVCGPRARAPSLFLCLALTLQHRRGMTGQWNYGERHYWERHGVCTMSSWSRGLSQKVTLPRSPGSRGTTCRWFVELCSRYPQPRSRTALACHAITEGQRGNSITMGHRDDTIMA
ncbi:hypothetical protein BD779DRAFT_1549643 [Infundibulicybe gibba]|nr:hypothetical protein BD779DRAFT_1549643 [Infundibulicybe gibba]